MKKQLFILLGGLLLAAVAPAQTLFTYGTHTVDAKDFLRAYEKNNTQPVTDRAKSINDYLDLYIRSRLKIQEAYDRRLDTLPAMKMELENLRTQISQNYMTDPDISAQLVKEAFNRSQKDIHVAHIFISNRNTTGFIDSVMAGRKLDTVLQLLKKGEDFFKTARRYSDDTSAATNNGDIGFITLLTLPYDFENAIYNTPAGKYSAPVRSLAGYHIFKNLGERKAVGKIKAQ
ncbi:MAG TPA: peptidylprolyl isomerase, partial [Chitinophagaceae bacterium]|nr:peptidylprolyl isomerase [Chitinophagaceae bacterium]